MKKKVYISGSISNNSTASEAEVRANIEEMREIERHAVKSGYEAVCPLDNGLDPKASWEEHMKADIIMMVLCDMVWVLPNWQKSRGSTLEVFIATQLGIPVEMI